MNIKFPWNSNWSPTETKYFSLCWWTCNMCTSWWCLMLGRDAMEPMRMIHMTRVVSRDDTCDNSSMAKRIPDKGALILAVEIGRDGFCWNNLSEIYVKGITSASTRSHNYSLHIVWLHQFHVGWLHQSVRANHGEIHHLKSLDSQSTIYEPNNIPKILSWVLKMESYTLEFLMCPGKMSQKRTANRPTTAATWNPYQLVPKAHWRKKQSRNRNPVRPVAT